MNAKYDLIISENEMIAIKIALRDYLESKRESFADCIHGGPAPHPDSNVGAALAAYNKMFALQQGSSIVTCDLNRVPGFLLTTGADAFRT